jgi:very-short-patch-repair endonuclease
MKRLNNVPKLKERRIELRKNQTPQEVVLWARLRLKNLGFKFKRQHSVGPYILDFYCPEKKLAIEIDGSQHIENKEYDNERCLYLSDLGIRTLRFWNNEINTDIVAVIDKIINELNNPLHPAKGEVAEGRRGF